jgi:hypothetical protein
LELRRPTLPGTDDSRSAPFLFQAAAGVLVVIRVSRFTADEGEEGKIDSRNAGKKKPREGLRREPFAGFKIAGKGHHFQDANKGLFQSDGKQITHELFPFRISGKS